MPSETQKVFDLVGGAEQDRTADLLNAIGKFSAFPAPADPHEIASTPSLPASLSLPPLTTIDHGLRLFSVSVAGNLPESANDVYYRQALS